MNKRYSFWTPEEDAKLIALSAKGLLDIEIAAAVSRSRRSVAERRRKLFGMPRRRVSPRIVPAVPKPATPIRERSEYEFFDWTIRSKVSPNGVKVSAGMVPA